MKLNIAVAILLCFFTFLISCQKDEQQYIIKGKFINDVTKEVIPSFVFTIYKVNYIPLPGGSPIYTNIATTVTNNKGEFDFGSVRLKSIRNEFVLQRDDSELNRDFVWESARAEIDMNENYHFYNFWAVPRFDKIHIVINKVSSISPGDSIYYSMHSKYLFEKNSSSEFVINGQIKYENYWDYKESFWNGPMGYYYIDIYKRINNSVTILHDTIFIEEKQELFYSIEF